MRFWCKGCKKDHTLQEHLVDTTWIPSYDTGFNFRGWVRGSGTRYFEAKCPSCGRKLFRYVDDISQDPFYFSSKCAIIERQKYAKDLIQYGQAGFSLYYKKQYDEIEKAREAAEQKMLATKRERDAYYQKVRHDSSDRAVVRKALEIEEQLSYGHRT